MDKKILLITCGMTAMVWSTASMGQVKVAPDSVQIESRSIEHSIASREVPHPPHINCTGGQMTIEAENSTMASVFAAVEVCLGVGIQIPEGDAGSRIFVEIGPAPLRTALETLLESAGYNYAIRSAKGSSGRVEAVLLTEPSGGQVGRADKVDASATESLVMTPARRAWIEARRTGRPTDPDPDGTDGAVGAAQTEPSPALEQFVATSGTGSDKSAGINASGVASGITGETDTSGKAGLGVNSPTLPIGEVVATPSEPAIADSVPTKQVQHGITNLEQLFEQRKQMMDAQSGTPKAQ